MKYRKWEKLAPKYNDQWVQKYSLRPTRREVEKIVLPLLEQNKDLKILDIGCGTGKYSVERINTSEPFTSLKTKRTFKFFDSKRNIHPKNLSCPSFLTISSISNKI